MSHLKVALVVPHYGFEWDDDRHCQLSKLRQACSAGELDLVVLGNDTAIPERMRSWMLFREGFHVIMPPTHRLAGATSLKCGDHQGSLVGTRRSSGDRKQDESVRSDFAIASIKQTGRSFRPSVSPFSACQRQRYG